MKLGKYTSLNNNLTRSTFLRFFNSIKLPDIDYMAFGIQNKINYSSISMMSNHEWQNLFQTEEFAKDDPVRKAAFNTKHTFLVMENIEIPDLIGQHIMEQRKKHEIKNGIIFLERNITHNFMLTLATGHSRFDPQKFILSYSPEIKKINNDLKLIFSNDGSSFIK